jgi:hypothetical protein
MPRKYNRKIPNITHNGIINVWDYVSFEDYPNEYGKRIYLDIEGLVDASEHELQSNKKYKNFEVEPYGVRRWENR